MKIEIAEQLEDSEKNNVNDYYRLFVRERYHGKEYRKYLTSRLRSHKIWLSETGFLFVPGTNNRQIYDDAGKLTFSSIEKVIRWLEGSPVDATVGFGDFRKRLSGFNHYEIEGMDLNRLYVERFILTNFQDALHLIPSYTLREAPGRLLTPRTPSIPDKDLHRA